MMLPKKKKQLFDLVTVMKVAAWIILNLLLKVQNISKMQL